MTRSSLILAAPLIALATVPALAEPAGWRRFELTHGCYIVVPAWAELAPLQTGAWSGVCTAGEPIGGVGALRFSISEAPEFAMVLEGAFVSGAPHGAFTVTVYEAGEAVDVSTPAYDMGCVAEDAACERYAPGVISEQRTKVNAPQHSR